MNRSEPKIKLRLETTRTDIHITGSHSKAVANNIRLLQLAILC